MPTRWIQFGEYSGLLINDGILVEQSHFDLTQHMHRAVWLTSQIEAPRFGLVQSYDGAGISGGLLHNVAVLPKSLEQGDLFQLVARMSHTATYPIVTRFFGDLVMKITPDGKVRYGSGVEVPGMTLRNIVAPPGGKVPRKGADYDAALRAATVFNRLFADPTGFRAQIDFAVDWLARGKAVVEQAVYAKYVNGYPGTPIGIPAGYLSPVFDLAMCVYHSFSVNAPTPAAIALTAALKTAALKAGDLPTFSAGLIRKLGTTKFGRWTDEPGDGSNRYDRTRRAVWKSGIWPTDMVTKLMPKDL